MHIGAAAAASAILPLLAQMQLMLGFIGGLKADVVAQFHAAVAFQISFVDPVAAIKNAITAALRVVAGLQASLQLGIPPLGVQVSASINLAAALQVRLSLINAAIDIALGVRLTGLNFLGQLTGALNAGPIVGYAWNSQSMLALQGEIAGYNFAADGFGPLTPVSGVMILTGAPSAYIGLQFMFVTPP